MFDKMVKMKNQKGFSLIEMLVVIAIIAILVSIVVPVVGVSKDKSAAATNAANLRAIEGQLATMRASQPILFDNAVEQLGASVNQAFQDMGFGVITSGFLTAGVTNLMEALGFSQFIEGDNALAAFAKYHLYHTTAVNKVLTIPVDPAIVINDVPTSKAVSVGNMNLPEGVEMTVMITDFAIVAAYEYGGASYTKNDFAEVAATGTYTGDAAGSGGLSGETAGSNAGQAIQCMLGNHKDSTTHYCTACGKLTHSSCKTTDGDCKCDYIDCKTSNNPIDTSKCYDTNTDTDLVCDYCGQTAFTLENHTHILGEGGKCAWDPACTATGSACTCTDGKYRLSDTCQGACSHSLSVYHVFTGYSYGFIPSYGKCNAIVWSDGTITTAN